MTYVKPIIILPKTSNYTVTNLNERLKIWHFLQNPTEKLKLQMYFHPSDFEAHAAPHNGSSKLERSDMNFFAKTANFDVYILKY